MDVPVPPLAFPFIPDCPALREGRLLRPPAREMAQTRLVKTFDCTSCRCSAGPSGASCSRRRRGRMFLPGACRCRSAASSMRAAPLHCTSELALNSRQWRQAHRDEEAARCGVAAALPQRTSADAQRTSAEVRPHGRCSKWCEGGPGKPARSVHRAQSHRRAVCSRKHTTTPGWRLRRCRPCAQGARGQPPQVVPAAQTLLAAQGGARDHALGLCGINDMCGILSSSGTRKPFQCAGSPLSHDLAPSAGAATRTRAPHTPKTPAGGCGFGGPFCG